MTGGHARELANYCTSIRAHPPPSTGLATVSRVRVPGLGFALTWTRPLDLTSVGRASDTQCTWGVNLPLHEYTRASSPLLLDTLRLRPELGLALTPT